MKRWTQTALVAIALTALLALAACSAPSATPGGSSGGSGSVAVSLENFSFNPSTIDVAVGGSVTFTNNDSTAHDVVGEGFDSGQIAPGASYTQTFSTAGSFPIHCSIHPSMTATVIVK